MIVTADPLGDFNATSQILRYSALAREVTVPRIPSISSTILSGTIAAQRSQWTSGRTTPTGVSGEEYDAAISEVARLGEEVEILVVRLAEEEGRRREAEEEWQRAEEKAEEVERFVREECWAEMEMKIDAERRRWMGAWGEEVSSAVCMGTVIGWLIRSSGESKRRAPRQEVGDLIQRHPKYDLPHSPFLSQSQTSLTPPSPQRPNPQRRRSHLRIRIRERHPPPQTRCDGARTAMSFSDKEQKPESWDTGIGE